MLKITIHTPEWWDEVNEEFIFDEYELELEHSLVSLSKWESEFGKFFLGKEEKTQEEVIAYVRCMNVTPDIPPGAFKHLSDENLVAINDYVNAKMTATTFSEITHQSPAREQISAELIYFWITSYQIPWEVQHWHLNRLFTLIRVFSAKNEDPKKKKANAADMMERRRQLNEQRRRELGTKG